LEAIRPEEIVLDIGGGDLRLARRMARVARRVYVLEMQADLLRQAAAAGITENVILLCGDARRLTFPPGITSGVLLMRHCRHFRQYAEKLRRAGAQRLITNARWRMGLEVVDLLGSGIPYEQLELGWFACRCGAAGFKPGPAERLTAELLTSNHEVNGCPACQTRNPRHGPRS
jgi:hypothetical protein